MIMEKQNLKIYWSKRLPYEQYFQVERLEEGLKILEESQGEAKIIAGGTDLLPQMRQKELQVKALVDITHVPGLDEIRSEDSLIRIGTAVTHSQIIKSLSIREKAFCLWEAVSQIGSPQIRNIATLGGNICNASPAADAVPALLVLEAVGHVATKQGERRVPLESFFTGPGQTVLGPCEILKGISIPEPFPHASTIYLKLGRRKGMDLALVSVAALLQVDPLTRICHSARISLGSVAPTPIRARKTEALLIGNPLSENLIREASAVAQRECEPISDVRGSAEYRREMVKVLVERAILQSLKRLEADHA